MEQKAQYLCDALAKRVVDGNFSEAHALFAPWLQQRMTPADLERLVTEASEGHAPARAWTLDEGFLEVEDLGEASREINDDNYRGWLCIQFNPGEPTGKGSASFDLWLAAVEHDGDYCVGHLEPAEAD